MAPQLPAPVAMAAGHDEHIPTLSEASITYTEVEAPISTKALLKNKPPEGQACPTSIWPFCPGLGATAQCLERAC